MRIQHIIWLPEVEDKLLRKHNVLIEEVEDVLFANPHVRFVEKGDQPGEDLYAAYGQTVAGRWLLIFYVLKPRQAVLVISARNMERTERRLYGRK
jgi:uncharacterized DUF497 family protein